MLSWIFCIMSGSKSLSPPITAASNAVFVKFIMLAAAFTPPKLDDLAELLEENCFFIMASSSTMAEGCTVSRLATR